MKLKIVTFILAIIVASTISFSQPEKLQNMTTIRNDEAAIKALENKWEIIETGSNVNNFKIGDKVYGLFKNGSYSEYIVANADLITYKPKSIDHYKAASVPVSALAAWQALF